MSVHSGSYDLITFDMDGTLLDSHKEILPSSREAIAEAERAGKIVCISTGRCMPEMRTPMQELQSVRYVIGASGAFIYDAETGEYLYRERIPEETVLTMLDCVRSMDVQVVLMSEKAYSQRDKVCHMADYNMGVYQEQYEQNFLQPEDVIAFYEQERFGIFKINLYCRTLADRDYIAGQYRERDLPLDLIYAEGTSLEATYTGVSKGYGFRKLCELLRLDTSRTIAVGDADNDLSVIAEAGLGVAMGNSNEHMLAAADVIVSDNDSGGCAEAIRNYLLK